MTESHGQREFVDPLEQLPQFGIGVRDGPVEIVREANVVAVGGHRSTHERMADSRAPPES